jgi:gamma-glutamylcyclotransferase (GGCT)/AIG2-like uncharacterized protein YtfP
MTPHRGLRYVFVYGTLRRGDDRDINRLSPAPRFVGPGLIRGVMYHLGAYPGVILDQGGKAGGRVVGEVYAIEAALERTLDEIEEIDPQHKDEYFKRQILVEVGARRLPCLVYEINPACVKDKPVIASGDWVRERAQERR